MTSPNPLVPVLIKETCIGCLLARGCAGFEAFNADDKSLGLFASAAAAIEALIAAASPPPAPEAA